MMLVRKGAYMKTDAQKKAQKSFEKNNLVSIPVKLNRNTDKDILEKLDNVPNKAGYIKGLIREDIKRGDL